ncbi:hypothetical protein OYT1_ch2263 [Ferriphaselus amnicola]|uniref:Uncharacterized protein n=1 Tax=Ferriphaselus amnicola TaxID=1188319 RepID=A0A2Z6GEM9_9PROT|nr:hypothetical protein OYT1_ch2263 [Ferriphaselus amnicola]
MTAAALVMSVLHQPEPVVMSWPLHKLFMYAGIAAAMSGTTFD